MSDTLDTPRARDSRPLTQVYIVGSGLYIAPTAAVADHLKTHTRRQMIADILDFWGRDCFKRSASSKPVKRVYSGTLVDDRVALDTLPTYVLAVILNQI